MIHWLAMHGVPYWGALNVFNYVTARAVFAVLTALAVGLMLGPRFISRLNQSGRHQPLRDDGPQNHLREKEKTPTMGGALILAALFVSTLLWADLSSRQVWAVMAVTLTFALIGFYDDRMKIVSGNSRGLSARVKILLQSAAAIVVLYALLQLGLVGESPLLGVPYMKDIYLPLGAAGFVVLGYFVIVGSSNAVNLTDGLDGLAIMPVVMIGGGMAIYAYASGHAVFSDYLGLPHLSGAQELVIFCAALIGAGLAFLWFNAYPAEVFMGDVGSLAIGAALGTIAVVVRQELVFFVMSGVFVVEAMSVILQVLFFKTTGRRIFLMAPLHHHFELKGWRENQIVVRFWIITLVLVLFGLAGLKIR